jgi:hypothetical protein
MRAPLRFPLCNACRAVSALRKSHENKGRFASGGLSRTMPERMVQQIAMNDDDTACTMPARRKTHEFAQIQLE